ncbi:MAG: hypothetical protein AB1807_05705 [Pseudomonadota bacterium]
MDTEDRTVTGHSVRSLVDRYATVLRNARDSGADLGETIRTQQDVLKKYMDGLPGEECQSFAILFDKEITVLLNKLLEETAELRGKQANRDQQHGRVADHAATWLFVILVLVFLAIAAKT